MVISLFAWVAAASAPAPVRAQERSVDLSEFYDALEPHGDWFEHRRYGYVWAPHVAEDDEWRPYTLGYWAPTEEHGWYWVSDEPFGWAVYHYGRWIDDEDFGWIWIPGSEWAPAWVAWRDSEDYVGWAPLPPEARWDGDGLTLRADYYDAPRFSHYWVFVPPRYFGVPGLHRHIVPRGRIASIMPRTRFVTQYALHDQRIFNRGIDPRDIERRRGGPITVLRIAPAQSRHDHGIRRGAVTVYRPSFRTAPPSPVAPRVFFPSDRRPEGQRRDFGNAGPDRRDGDRPRSDWRRDVDRRDSTTSSDRRPTYRPSESSASDRRELWRRPESERRSTEPPRDAGRSFERRQTPNDAPPRFEPRSRDQRFGAPAAPSGGTPALTPPPTSPAITAPAKPAVVQTPAPTPRTPVETARQTSPPTQAPRETRARDGGGQPGAAERGRGGPTAGPTAGQGGGRGDGQRGKDGEKEKKRLQPGEKPPAG